jgi:hypothetical protein
MRKTHNIAIEVFKTISRLCSRAVEVCGVALEVCKTPVEGFETTIKRDEAIAEASKVTF